MQGRLHTFGRSTHGRLCSGCAGKWLVWGKWLLGLQQQQQQQQRLLAEDIPNLSVVSSLQLYPITFARRAGSTPSLSPSRFGSSSSSAWLPKSSWVASSQLAQTPTPQWGAPSTSLSTIPVRPYTSPLCQPCRQSWIRRQLVISCRRCWMPVEASRHSMQQQPCRMRRW